MKILSNQPRILNGNNASDRKEFERLAFQMKLKSAIMFMIMELYGGLKFALKAVLVTFIIYVTLFNTQVQSTKLDKTGHLIVTNKYDIVEVYTPLQSVKSYMFER